MLSMVDIGERVCLYAFMHVSMRLRSSMILSSTCAVAGWWRAGGGAGRGWWLQRGRAGQQEPATTTRHSLPYSLSLSRSLAPSVRPRVRRWSARAECRLDLIDVIKSFYSARGRWKIYSWNSDRTSTKAVMKSLFSKQLDNFQTDFVR